MKPDNLVARAAAFAKQRHGDQKRKWTGEPYYRHCENVAALVAERLYPREVIAAAYMHDLIEDTATTFKNILVEFGINIACLVKEVTDVSKPEDGNRKARKEIDLRHLAIASPYAQTIKLADLIDNTASIVAHDKNFARVYLEEKAALLEVLTDGDRCLRARAFLVLEDAQRDLVQHELGKMEDGIR